MTGTLSLGRLTIAAHVSHSAHARALSLMFKHAWRDETPRGGIDGELQITQARPDTVWPDLEPDRLCEQHTADVLVITTETVCARVDLASTPWRARIELRASDLPAHEQQVHLSIAMHRILLAFGMVYLHAGAVAIDGRAHLFIGEKGAGKSTVCLALARRGATVLSDDHVMLEHRAGEFAVSGCEDTSRVTSESERFLFETPLDIVPEDFAGTMKKEFPLSRYFLASPRTSVPLAALYFPYVGGTLRVGRQPAQRAMIELLNRTRRSFRPQRGADVARLLDFWAALTIAVPAFDLELAPDMQTLARLPALIPA